MSQKFERPLSPHITIYKPQITSVMSILHRISGTGLALSLVFFVWFLLSLAGGETAYNSFMDCAGSFFGCIAIFVIVLGLYYHLFNGIRHLAWDAGHGYKMETVTKSGIVVLVLTALATLITLIAIAF